MHPSTHDTGGLLLFLEFSVGLVWSVSCTTVAGRLPSFELTQTQTHHGCFVQVNLVLNLDPAERNRKSMMNYLTEYIREVPLNSKAKQAMARNYAFHLQVRLCL